MSVGSFLSFEIEQFDEGGESRYCLRAEDVAQRHPASQDTQAASADTGETGPQQNSDATKGAPKKDDARNAASESEGERVSVLLPKPRSVERADALSIHHVGAHRFRIIRSALITPPTQQHASAWSADQLQPSAYALSLAVDRPLHLHPSSISTKNRAATVLRPLEPGESVEVWMSTRHAAQQHIVFGREVSDQLDLALRTELLSTPHDLQLQTLDVQTAR